MLPSHSLHLRPALTSLKIQPILLTPCCALSTTSKPTQQQQQQRRFLKSPTRPSTTSHTHKPSHHNLTRFESTTTTTTTTVTPLSQPQPQPPTSPSPSTPPPPLHPLTWNAYLSLRKTRRRYNLASSVLSSVLTTAGGMSLLTSSFNIEHVNFFGLDPFLMLGLVTLGSGAVGWLLGPFVGNAVFGMAHRRVGGQIAEKEKDFYRRIKKHRVDPSGGSSANPVPDYYGEKIGSVKEYRNWMKDQRAFNRRRQNFL